MASNGGTRSRRVVAKSAGAAFDLGQIATGAPAQTPGVDIRLDVLRINGLWTLTNSGSDQLTFDREKQALDAGIAWARRHHQDTGGAATVYVWHRSLQTLAFDTKADRGS